ncbi:MAG TPA: hypothetical protein VLZ83_09450 [Edaphocola sp.]|nr:hypothetical protein [Edaphocola sp.]
MFFNCSSTISSKLSAKELNNKLAGQKVEIKGLEFDVKSSDGIIKLIPLTENDATSRIAPISHVVIESNGDGSKVCVRSKPRRLDLGGLYLVVGAILLLLGIAIYLYIAYPERTLETPMILVIASFLAFLIFRIRLHTGYYSYIGGIRKFIRENAN